MRRWLAIVMLALLPLQFSWAAVAAYCGHETGRQTRHLGHHEHLHAAVAQADEAGNPGEQTSAAAFDFDCGHCHATCVSLPAPVDPMAQPASAGPLNASVEDAVRTLALSPPERPQWRVLA